MQDFKRGTARANQLTFEYLTEGDGPLALCVHGFPDSPYSYRYLLPALAEAGYRALVPDLYRGKVASAADEANHLMGNLNFPDAAGQDIRGAVQYLKQGSQKVAVGGFCLGGALTLLCAAQVPEMDAGACFYGIPPPENFDPKSIKIPLICHFANQDDWCTPAKANELEAALKQSKSKYEIYRYDAHHAFMNEARPEVYDAQSAKAAWERTLKFLKQAFA